MAPNEFTTIVSKDFTPDGKKTVLKKSKGCSNFESFDTVVSMDSTFSNDCSPLVKTVFSKDSESNAVKAYKTAVNPSKEKSNKFDAVNTIILLDSNDHHDLIKLMDSNDEFTPRGKLYCQICFYITVFYTILIFFSIIFVLICIRYGG